MARRSKFFVTAGSGTWKYETGWDVGKSESAIEAELPAGVVVEREPSTSAFDRLFKEKSVDVDLTYLRGPVHLPEA